MIKLIADSGSTKTKWMMYIHGEIVSCETQGIHPSFLSDEGIAKIIQEELPLNFKQNISHLFFYGTGCAEEGRKNRVQNVLENIFTSAHVEVHSDLLGAARACCHQRAGIVAIIGTGSSVCQFNGREIEYIRPSLGYLLGDEGSGNYLGRKMLSDFFTDVMPSHLAEELKKEYDVSRTTVLDGLYSQPFPNRYLASFFPFLYDHKETSYVKSLVKNGFQELFTHHINKLYHKTKLPVHFNGSVAFLFQDILMEVARANQIELGEIIKEPREQLVVFHKL